MILVRVSSFQGVQTLPIRVAHAQGFFAAQGLDVRLAHAVGSASQLAELARGQCELVQTAPDNVIHFNADPAAFASDLPPTARLMMVLGGSLGPLSLWAQPGLATAASLRGATMGVDNPTSGFALVLRDMLRRSLHLEPDDYALALAGGTSQRSQALARGECAATILYLPLDLLAHHAGCHRLAISTDLYPAYASLATAGTAEWVYTHQDTVVRYLRALLSALYWIYDPAHAAHISQIIHADDLPNYDVSLAHHAYAAFVAPATGFGVGAPLADAALRQVMALRTTYAGPIPTALAELDAHRDLRWYAQARASL